MAGNGAQRKEATGEGTGSAHLSVTQRRGHAGAGCVCQVSAVLGVMMVMVLHLRYSDLYFGLQR